MDLVDNLYMETTVHEDKDTWHLVELVEMHTQLASKLYVKCFWIQRYKESNNIQQFMQKMANWKARVKLLIFKLPTNALYTI